MNPDYLMLGHITSDLLPDGTTIPGGTSLYAARTAQRLDRRPAIVSAKATLPADWPTDVPVATVNHSSAPIFENRYTPNGRIQFLHGDALPLAASDIPSAWRGAPIVHFGPILAETPLSLVDAFPDALIGMTPQGMMRRWHAPFPCQIEYIPFEPAPALLARVTYALNLGVGGLLARSRLLNEGSVGSKGSLHLVTLHSQNHTKATNGHDDAHMHNKECMKPTTVVRAAMGEPWDVLPTPTAHQHTAAESCPHNKQAASTQLPP